MRSWRFSSLAAVAAVVGLASVPSVRATAQSQPGEVIGHTIKVPGTRVAGTTSRLSEVEAEMVAALPPQGQAERLLQYAISRHSGATDAITTRVDGWRGRITRTPSLETLVEVALNGSDLRVRAAANEIELAAMNIGKTPADAARLMEEARRLRHPFHQLWAIGILANRGVAVEAIVTELRVFARSEDEGTRFWAISALSYVGTDETVPDLVLAFRRDPSRRVRIDAGGCGLAHSGMLTRAQRMIAVPALIEMVDDASLDRETVGYGYRALREITDETLPDNVAAWRQWFAAHGADTTDRFRKFEDRR